MILHRAPHFSHLTDFVHFASRRSFVPPGVILYETTGARLLGWRYRIDRVRGKRVKTSVVKNFVIVDYENVQPGEKELELLRGGPFELWICCGPHQGMWSTEIVNFFLGLGLPVALHQVKTRGKQAVDMAISFIIGKLAKEHPKAFYHILSKDGDFAPLAKHLKEEEHLQIASVSKIEEIGYFRPNTTVVKPQVSLPTKLEERICLILERLSRPASPRPQSQKALGNTINSFFQKTLKEKEVEALVNELIRRKRVVLNGKKIIYHLLPKAISPAPVKEPAKPQTA